MSTANERGVQQNTEEFIRTFIPEHYRPCRKSDVRVLDRGENETGKRYILKAEHADNYMPLAAEDLRLWQMFDGEKTVQQILAAYVGSYKTIPLHRIVLLLGELWRNDFLRNDPQLENAERHKTGGILAYFRRCRLHLPFLRKLPTALMQLPAARMLLSLPLIFIYSVVAACGLVLTYFYSPQLLMAMLFYFRNDATVIPLIILVLTINLLISAVRETVRGMTLLKLGIPVTDVSLVFRYAMPLFAVDSWHVFTKARITRLKVRAAGLLFDLFLMGVVATLLYAADTMHFYLFFAVVFVRPVLTFCPLLDNDFYRLLADYFDEPELRRKTWGFIKQNYGRMLPSSNWLEFLPYLILSLASLLWVNLLLGAAHSAVSGWLGAGAVAFLLATLTVALPLMIIAGSLIIWGCRLLFENMKRARTQEHEPNLLITELFGLGLITVATFSLPDNAKNLFALNIMLMTLAVVLFMLFSRKMPFSFLERPGSRFLLLALWTQILWLPIILLTYHAVAQVYLPIPWLLVIAFAAVIFLYFVLAALRPDFLSRGPALSVAEGLIWLHFPVLLLAITVLLHLSRTTEYFAYHSFALSGLVLGCGLLFLGFTIPAQFIGRCPVTVKPYPFVAAADNAQKLDQAFTYFVTSIFDSILTSFGSQALIRVKSDFNSLSQTEHGESIFSDTQTHFEPIDVQANHYGQFLRNMRTILNRYCGHIYTECLFKNIMEHVHWTSRRLLYALIWPERPDQDHVHVNDAVLLQALAKLPITRDIPDAMLAELASTITPVKVQSDHVIVPQNHAIKQLIVVLDGIARTEEKDVTGKMRIGAYLRLGDFFGETSFLPENSDPNQWTVRACTEVTIGCIKAEDFAVFMKSFPGAGLQIRKNIESILLMKEMPIFKELPPSLANSLLTRVRHCGHSPGQTVISEGEPGSSFYIIKKGTAEVYYRENGNEEKVAELHEGNYFGEIALLTDAPRNATVKALDALEVGIIAKEDFLSLRKQIYDFKEDIDDAVKIRSRSK